MCGHWDGRLAFSKMHMWACWCVGIEMVVWLSQRCANQQTMHVVMAPPDLEASSVKNPFKMQSGFLEKGPWFLRVQQPIELQPLPSVLLRICINRRTLFVAQPEPLCRFPICKARTMYCVFCLSVHSERATRITLRSKTNTNKKCIGLESQTEPLSDFANPHLP